MIQHVKDLSLSQIIDIESKLSYYVPRYQREYAWSKWQWDELFDDIVDNDRGYFLGSIICIISSVERLEVVDGQQRMLSLSLLMCAIYKYLSTRQDISDDDRYKLANLKRKLIFPDSMELRFTPQFQNYNYDDYKTALNDAGLLSEYVYEKWAGNRRILRAYRHFEYRLEQLVESNGGKNIIFKLLEKINSVVIVRIDVNSYSDAFILFESLNNRGVPLTPVDLIKNKLLANYDYNDKLSVDKIYGKWQLMINHLPDEYNLQERFLRYYYNAFKTEIQKYYSVSIATRSNIIKIYSTWIEKNPNEFIDKMLVASNHYGQFLDTEKINTEKIGSELQETLLELSRVQAAPAYILLLYLFNELEDQKTREEEIVTIVNILIIWFIRRNVTDYPPTRDLNKIFMDLVEEMRDSSRQEKVIVFEFLEKKLSTDETFEDKLKGDVYTENPDITRYILSAMASEGMTKETHVDLWERVGKRLKWQIEHIFPQGENIPEDWINMIANGDREAAIEIQKKNVHKIGNLTLTAYNQNLGNLSFIKKRDRQDVKGRSIGYKNGLNINSELANKEKWTENDILERTTKMVSYIIEKYSYTKYNINI